MDTAEPRETTSALISGDDRSAIVSAARERLIRYAAVDSQADPRVGDDHHGPSSEGQRVLGAMLADELQALGLESIVHTEHGVVLATLPGRGMAPRAPVLGLLAHVDTSPD